MTEIRCKKNPLFSDARGRYPFPTPDATPERSREREIIEALKAIKCAEKKIQGLLKQ